MLTILLIHNQRLTPQQNSSSHYQFESSDNNRILSQRFTLNSPKVKSKHENNLLEKFKSKLLRKVCSENRPMLAKMLIRLGANVNLVDKFGLSPLFIALTQPKYERNTQIVELLLSSNCNVNSIVPFTKQTVLHVLCQQIRSFEDEDKQLKLLKIVLKLVLNYHAEIRLTDHKHLTPINYLEKCVYINPTFYDIFGDNRINIVTELSNRCKLKSENLIRMSIKIVEAFHLNRFLLLKKLQSLIDKEKPTLTGMSLLGDDLLHTIVSYL